MTIKIEDPSEPKEFVITKHSEFARVGQKGDVFEQSLGSGKKFPGSGSNKKKSGFGSRLNLSKNSNPDSDPGDKKIPDPIRIRNTDVKVFL